ncbi:MAG: hypothetical protein KAF91_02535 [Nostoc sp. TH1S01]|nr:hypothetical protein [Nostoc sp. TH1S01]
MKKNFFLAAFTLSAVSLASTLLSVPANTQAAETVSTDVQINLVIPSFVFLQTYQSLTFKPTLADITNTSDPISVIKTQNGVISSSTSATTTTIEPSLSDPNNSSGSYKTDIPYNDVLVYKVWGTPEDGKYIYHQVTVKEKTLTKEGGTSTDTIEMEVTGTDAQHSSAVQITSDHPIYDNAKDGKLNFNFKLGSNVKSGTYSGGTITITAYTQ